MKRSIYRFLLPAMVLMLTLGVSCAKVDDLDDQSPALIVHINALPGIAITETEQVYLIYYTSNNWANPWFQHGSSITPIINPVVLTDSVYIAAFWDANGNGIVDAGEPCTGYDNADHTGPDALTQLIFFPLEWREITITLDPLVVY